MTVLENCMAMNFGYMLEEHELVAHDIYHGFFERSLRDKMFMKLARSRLADDECDELKKLQNKVRGLADARNTIVHATWASNDKYPKGLLMMDWAALNERFTRIAHGGPDRPLEKPVLYQIRDFRETLKRISTVQDSVNEFGKRIYYGALRRSVQRSNKNVG